MTDTGVERTLRAYLAAANAAGTVTRFRRALFREYFAQHYAALLRFGRSGRMLPFLFVLILIMGIVTYSGIESQDWRAGFRYLIAVLVLFFGIPGILVFARAWWSARVKTKQLDDPRRLLQIFFQLGWEQHPSTTYLIAPTPAEKRHVHTLQAMELRWKRFHREALKELQFYIGNYYDEEAMMSAGLSWDATVRVQLKPLKHSKDGVLARTAYRLQFPRLLATDGTVDRFQLPDVTPTPLFELEGTASFVQTKGGAWLIAEGPLDPLELIHGPEQGQESLEDELFG